MRADADPILDADLHAYVDEQLDTTRRIAVEAYLAARPEEAARVMADLRTRDELRLSLSSVPLPPTIRTQEAAGRLERSLKRRGAVRRLSRAAAVVAAIGAGWVAHAEFGALGIRESVASPPPPAFVHEAVMAHQTTRLRAAMPSQVEVTDYDPAEILSATAIAMPALPAGWTVEDVQIFPSTFGPSVEMAVTAEDLGEISLFAVRPGRFDVVSTSLVRQADVTAAYWQVGEVAYALVSKSDGAAALERAARRIEQTLH